MQGILYCIFIYWRNNSEKQSKPVFHAKPYMWNCIQDLSMRYIPCFCGTCMWLLSLRNVTQSVALREDYIPSLSQYKYVSDRWEFFSVGKKNNRAIKTFRRSANLNAGSNQILLRYVERYLKITICWLKIDFIKFSTSLKSCVFYILYIVHTFFTGAHSKIAAVLCDMDSNQLTSLGISLWPTAREATLGPSKSFLDLSLYPIKYHKHINWQAQIHAHKHLHTHILW